MRRVYVAGPLETQGFLIDHVRNAIDAGDRLLNAGFAPYIPHITVLWGLVHSHPYQEWIDLDLEWLAVCDYLLRLPGESNGADIEVRFALEHNIPVYYSLEELFESTTGRTTKR